MTAQDLLWLLPLLLICGGLGGFLMGMTNPRVYSVRVPFRAEGSVEFGFLGDMLLGASAALAVMLIGPAFLGRSLSSAGGAVDVEFLLRLIALGVIAGFAGRNLLPRLSTTLVSRIDQVEERLDRKEATDEILRQADFQLFVLRDFAKARDTYVRALEIDPRSRPAKQGKANALAYLGRDSSDLAPLLQADEDIGLLLQEDENDADAAYNRAWVRALIMAVAAKKGVPSPHDVEQVVRDMERAIALDDSSRRWAREEADFRWIIGESAEFRQAIGAPEPAGPVDEEEPASTEGEGAAPKKATKKTTKKAAKKVSKKAVKKKSTKKVSKKATKKKTTKKKTTKKKATKKRATKKKTAKKKTAKKRVTRKTAKQSTAAAPRRVAAKTARKPAKKAAKRSVRKASGRAKK